MKYCTQCKKEQKGTFCGTCGQKLIEIDPSQLRQNQYGQNPYSQSQAVPTWFTGTFYSYVTAGLWALFAVFIFFLGVIKLSAMGFDVEFTIFKLGELADMAETYVNINVGQIFIFIIPVIFPIFGIINSLCKIETGKKAFSNLICAVIGAVFYLILILAAIAKIKGIISSAVNLAQSLMGTEVSDVTVFLNAIKPGSALIGVIIVCAVIAVFSYFAKKKNVR